MAHAGIPIAANAVAAIILLSPSGSGDDLETLMEERNGELYFPEHEQTGGEPLARTVVQGALERVGVYASETDPLWLGQGWGSGRGDVYLVRGPERVRIRPFAITRWSGELRRARQRRRVRARMGQSLRWVSVRALLAGPPAHFRRGATTLSALARCVLLPMERFMEALGGISEDDAWPREQ